MVVGADRRHHRRAAALLPLEALALDPRVPWRPVPYFICPNCKERSIDLDRKEGLFDEAVACLETAGLSVSAEDPDVALATVELARLLRRMGRWADAGVAWSRLGAADGPLAALGWIELAKEREHRERDLPGAWAATDEALLALYRSRGKGAAMLRRGLESDLVRRRARLARRLERLAS